MSDILTEYIGYDFKAKNGNVVREEVNKLVYNCFSIKNNIEQIERLIDDGETLPSYQVPEINKYDFKINDKILVLLSIIEGFQEFMEKNFIIIKRRLNKSNSFYNYKINHNHQAIMELYKNNYTLECIKDYIKKYGVDNMDEDGKTLLWHEVILNRESYINLLLDEGADVDLVNPGQNSILFISFRYISNINVISNMIKKSKNINYVSIFEKDYICQSISINSIELFKELIDNGCSLKLSTDNNNLLKYAISYKSLLFIELFINLYNIDKEIIYNTLMIADPEIIKIFIKNNKAHCFFQKTNIDINLTIFVRVINKKFLNYQCIFLLLPFFDKKYITSAVIYFSDKFYSEEYVKNLYSNGFSINTDLININELRLDDKCELNEKSLELFKLLSVYDDNFIDFIKNNKTILLSYCKYNGLKHFIENF